MTADASERRTATGLWLALAASAVIHAALIAAAFLVLADPRALDSMTQPVMVDLVPEREVAATKEPPAKEPPKLDLPEDKPADKAQTAGAAPAPAPAPAPANPPQPQAALMPPAPAQPATAPDPFTGSPFDFPSLLPGILGGDFDAPADASAKLTAEEVAAFHAHLQKCWHPPASVAAAPNLRASLRITLTPSGALAREPLLIRASASAQGPRLVETATRALQQCQPFTFLPAEKYQEWKLLDLSFSPSGLAGG